MLLLVLSGCPAAEPPPAPAPAAAPAPAEPGTRPEDLVGLWDLAGLWQVEGGKPAAWLSVVVIGETRLNVEPLDHPPAEFLPEAHTLVVEEVISPEGAVRMVGWRDLAAMNQQG